MLNALALLRVELETISPPGLVLPHRKRAALVLDTWHGVEELATIARREPAPPVGSLGSWRVAALWRDDAADHPQGRNSARLRNR